ncbi:MAG: VCBS repeat-containing protein [Candidatus Nealsonbacteria bacterium]|nr:VCBS repeat-containing protein [Candidatus Nealsonbacteria bacterium]
MANNNQANRVWLNDGQGTFSDSGQRLGNYFSLEVSLGDLDSDGDLDAFVANYYGNRVWVNDGQGTFSDSGQSLGSSKNGDVSLGDLDGDGDLDALVAKFDYEANQVLLNDGAGTFSDSGQTLGSSSSWDVSLGDLDGDGDLDAFVANVSAQANRVWLNDGQGTFSDSGQSLGNSNSSMGVSLGDLDGDGDLDAFVVEVTLAGASAPNRVWLNDGQGTFSDSGQSLGNSYSYNVSLGDLDGDGDLDAFVADDGSNRVWINISAVAVAAESLSMSAPSEMVGFQGVPFFVEKENVEDENGILSWLTAPDDTIVLNSDPVHQNASMLTVVRGSVNRQQAVLAGSQDLVGGKLTDDIQFFLVAGNRSVPIAITAQQTADFTSIDDLVAKLNELITNAAVEDAVTAGSEGTSITFTSQIAGSRATLRIEVREGQTGAVALGFSDGDTDVGEAEDGLFFVNQPDGASVELYRFARTEPVVTLDAMPSQLFAAGDRLFFTVVDAEETHLWVSDGSPANTGEISLPPFSTDPAQFTDVGGTLFFTAEPEPILTGSIDLPLTGQLTEDVAFTLQCGGASIRIELAAADTSTNASIEMLVTQFNEVIAQASADQLVAARRSGDRLAFSAVDLPSGSLFRVIVEANDAGAEAIGFAHDDHVVSGPKLFQVMELTEADVPPDTPFSLAAVPVAVPELSAPLNPENLTAAGDRLFFTSADELLVTTGVLGETSAFLEMLAEDATLRVSVLDAEGDLEATFSDLAASASWDARITLPEGSGTATLDITERVREALRTGHSRLTLRLDDFTGSGELGVRLAADDFGPGSGLETTIADGVAADLYDEDGARLDAAKSVFDIRGLAAGTYYLRVFDPGAEPGAPSGTASFEVAIGAPIMGSFHPVTDRDEIHGGDGDDLITGNSQVDTLFGDSGRDAFRGESMEIHDLEPGESFKLPPESELQNKKLSLPDPQLQSQIPDPRLLAALAEALGLPVTQGFDGTPVIHDPVLASDLGELYRLDLSSLGIKDLTGLEYAVNVRSLNLGNNPIEDISMLLPGRLTAGENAGMLIGMPKLRSLALDSTLAADLSPLASLGQLDFLSMDRAVFSDSQAFNRSLVDVENLRFLSLAGSGLNLDVRDVSALVGVSLIDDGDPEFKALSSELLRNVNPVSTAFEGDYRFAEPASGPVGPVAQWTFMNLRDGTYELLVTWPAHESRSTAATYQVFDGPDSQPDSPLDVFDAEGNVVGDVSVNQQLDPSGATLGNRPWESLGFVEVVDGVVRVTLASDTEGFVAADAMRLEAVQPVLANLEVLNLEGNPLDNRAQECYLPLLENPNLTLSFDKNTAPVLAQIGPQTATSTGGALLLDGGYIKIEEVPPSSSLDIGRYLTLEITFEVDEDAFNDTSVDWIPLVYKGDGISGTAGRTYSLWLSRDDSLYFTSSDAVFGQTSVNTAVGSIVPGTTYHFAGVMDRATSQMYGYLDGELVAQEEIPYVHARPRITKRVWYTFWLKTVVVDPGSPEIHYDAVSTDKELLIGGTHETDDSLGPFAGRIDEVRIWETVRSQTEIAAGMNADLTGEETDLAALWKFEETSGTTIFDSCQNNGDNYNNGTIIEKTGGGGWGREGRIKLPVEEPDGQPVFFDFECDQAGIEVSNEGGSMVISAGGFVGTARITVTASDGTREHPLGGTDQMHFDYTVGENAVYGSVFLDENGDGQRDGGEGPLDGITVFLDQNEDGVLDPGETVTYTDANGEYAFRNLPFDANPKEYRVAQVPYANWAPTSHLVATPEGPIGRQTVSIGDAGGITEHVDFGNTPFFVVTTLVDENDGDLSLGDLSLREVLGLAASYSGRDVIRFAPDLAGRTIELVLGELQITSDLDLMGLGVTIVAAENSRVLRVDDNITATISDLTITGGYTTSNNSGAGILNDGELSVINSTIAGNSSGWTGGGIFNTGTLWVVNSTISGNRTRAGSYSGGGIRNQPTGMLWVVNSTISGNSSAALGGGIFNYGTLSVVNSTIFGNTADSDGDETDAGGGIATYANGSITLHNTIVAGNVCGTAKVPDDLSGNLVETGSSHNLIGDAGTSGGLSGEDNILGADPRLAPLGDYGGPTQTHALLPDSPAIDAGNNGLAVDSNNNPLEFDQRGEPFDRIVGGAVDVGAFESRYTPPTVKARQIFYNNSTFDGDNAVALDKQALLPGQTASFANYTSYSRGINGLMIDLADLPAGVTPGPADFLFHIGNDDTPGNWLAAAEPESVTFHPGAGTGGSDRVTIIWDDGAIRNTWLQVTVLDTILGLAGNDVFYYGNAVAEAGNSTTDARVTTTDLLLARNNPRSLLDEISVTFPYDFDRDGHVNATDVLFARNNQTNFLSALNLIDLTGAAEEEAQELSQAELAWLTDLDQPATQRPAEKDAAAEAVDQLLATYWP